MLMLRIGIKTYKINISGKVWFTSDTHFGHANIIKYCNRPFKSVHHMNKEMTKIWNNTVGENDLVIHLGDVSFNSDQYISRLNGKIFLVKGNHDNNKYNNLFEAVVEKIPMKIGKFNCYLTHRPIDPTRQYKIGREPDFSILDRYDFIICGHVHDAWRTKGKNVNVGIDIWHKPIYIKDLIKFLKRLKHG